MPIIEKLWTPQGLELISSLLSMIFSISIFAMSLSEVTA